MLSLGPWLKKRFVLRIHSDVSFSGGKWFDVSLLVWALFSLVSFGLGCCQKAGPTHARPGEMLQIYSAHYLSASIRFFFVTPKLVQETIRLVCNTEVFGSTPFMRHYSITIIFKHLRNSYKIAAAFTLFESSLSQSIKPRLRNHNNFGGFWHLHQLAPQLDPDQSRSNPSINHQSAAEEPQFP